MAELSALLSDLSTADKLTLKEAQHLRGRLQFADNQIFGCASRLCLKALDEHMASKADKLSSDVKIAMQRYLAILSGGLQATCGG